MRLSHLAIITAALLMNACGKTPPVKPDIVALPPGIDIRYQNQPAKLFGAAPCGSISPSSNSCLIFQSDQPQAIGIVITKDNVYQLNLRMRQDPTNLNRFVIEDEQGHRLLSTSGYTIANGNIDIAD